MVPTLIQTVGRFIVSHEQMLVSTKMQEIHGLSNQQLLVPMLIQLIN